MKPIVLATASFIAALLLASPSPVQASQVKLDVATGQPVLLAGKPQTSFLKIGLTGFELTDREARPSVNLAVVIDRSSSMSGEKIQKAKEAAMIVVDRLRANDILSIVAYDSTVEVLLEAGEVADRTAARRAIAGLTPRGSTALFAGVSRGLAEVRRHLDDRRVNRVILISDGQANVGPSSPNELGRLGMASGKEGIAITTIGLGLGYNEDLMMQLAQKSDGNHAFVERATDLAKIFDYELGDVLSVVAQEISVKVRVQDGMRPVRVLNRDGQIHGQEVFLSLNQLYARQEKYFLIEVAVPAGVVGASQKIAKVDLSYANMLTGQTDRLSSEASVTFTSSRQEVAKHEASPVMVAAVEARAVEQNRQAVALRDEGKVKEAQKLLLDNASFLKKNAELYKSERLETYRQSNETDATNLDEPSWNKQRKSMRKVQHELDAQQSY